MKRDLKIWIPLLLASHVLAYFAAGRLAPASLAETVASSAPEQDLPEAKSPGRKAGRANHAELLRQLKESNLPEKQYQRARGKLMENWIKTDLAGALDFILSPKASADHYAYGSGTWETAAQIREEMKRQPLAVWQWIRSGRYGSNRATATEMWAEAMGEDKQRELLGSAMMEGTPAEQQSCFDALYPAATAKELGEMREWLSGVFRDHPDRDGLISGYADRFVLLAGGDIQAIFGSEEDPKIREALGDAWVEREITDLPADLVAKRLADLPPDVLRTALPLMMDCRGSDDLGMDEIARIVNAIDGQSLWGALDQDQLFDQVRSWIGSSYNTHVDVGEMFGYLAGISNATLRDYALKAAGESWSCDDVESATIVLQSLPEGSDRDAFLSKVLPQLDPGENKDFEAILGLVSDASLREQIEKEMEEQEEPEMDGFHAPMEEE